MTDLSKQWRQFEGKALYAYHRLITLTSRWNFTGQANLTQARASDHPILWTMWHGQVMPFIMYGDRFQDANRFCIITVGDDRGDSLSTLGDEIGAKMYKVDMQGNPVAAGRAVLRVIQAMKQGNDSMIAPDGPDGPAYEPKGGVAMLAKKSGAAVVPVGIWTRQAYRRQRWDRYLIPFPFAHIHLAFGTPIFAKRNTPTDSLLAQISEALHAVTSQARQSAGIV
ncbi:MAG: hypothetical protein GY803_09605 [Chloroflexi bacterium]|nr:hypothetical protein [Chloroflexota bacterium]